MKNTKIISGFPGIGKSYLFKNNKNLIILDSDSSQYSWIKDKNGNNTDVRNPNFPNNYITHIKDNLGKVDIILISSHEIVRKAMEDNNLKYILIYPAKSLKDEYIQRYIDRKNNNKFITFMIDNLDDFINEIETEKFPTKLKLWDNEYLSDILNKKYCPIYKEFCSVNKTNADEYEGNPCCRCNCEKSLIKKVFLGGTCNDSKWRNELIKLLKMDYFNPVVEDWTEECMVEERKQRKECDYVLYVITPKMTGVYSIAEVIDDSNKRPEKTLFCFLDEDDDHFAKQLTSMPVQKLKFDKGQLRSLGQVGKMVERNGGKYFKTLKEVADYLNKLDNKGVY